MQAEARGEGRLTFRLADPDHRFGSVRLDAGLGTAGQRPDLTWAQGEWTVTVDLPPLSRVEYGFEITQTIADPQNSHTIDSGFGPRSVMELPGYRTPLWLQAPAVQGTLREVMLAAEGLTASIWAPAGLAPEVPAPLLVAFDGGAYVERAALTQYVGSLIAAGDIGPTRILLVDADPREVRYAADDTFATQMIEVVLPTVAKRWAIADGALVALGASLGALTALHLQWRYPGTFSGLMLQSGSFFTAATDSQEQRFSGWESVTDFVQEVRTQERAAALQPLVITCGAHEENAANNAELAAHLSDIGVDVTHTETADLHNLTAWRDALDPPLGRLLAAAGRP